MDTAVSDQPAPRLSSTWRTAWRTAWRASWRAVVDFGLPPLCPSSQEPERNVGLCAGCWSKLSFIAPPFCARLGIPFAFDPGPGVLSLQAIADPPSDDRARAAVRYDDVARPRTPRACPRPLDGNGGRELLADADSLVSVPLHWRRLWMRRFNQAAALAGAISKASGVPVLVDSLKRVKATPQQVGLSRSERAVNVQGAFRVPAARRANVLGRRLVLVDDVLTTGATVDACARALLRPAPRTWTC